MEGNVIHAATEVETKSCDFFNVSVTLIIEPFISDSNLLSFVVDSFDAEHTAS